MDKEENLHKAFHYLSHIHEKGDGGIPAGSNAETYEASGITLASWIMRKKAQSATLSAVIQNNLFRQRMHYTHKSMYKNNLRTFCSILGVHGWALSGCFCMSLGDQLLESQLPVYPSWGMSMMTLVNFNWPFCSLYILLLSSFCKMGQRSWMSLHV